MTYAPTANEFYSDRITVRVSDNSQASDSKVIPITVNYVNIIPVAQSQTLATNEDTALGITLVATDANLPSETLTYTIRTLPTRGTLSFNGQAITAVPFSLGPSRAISFLNAPYSFGDPYTTFTFTANDGRADSATATVTISVSHVNHPPVISTSSPVLQATRDQVVPFIIIAQDFDAGNLLNVTITPREGDERGYFTFDGEKISETKSFRGSNLQVMELLYTAPNIGTGDNDDYNSVNVTITDNMSQPVSISVSFDVLFEALPPIAINTYFSIIG